MPITFNNSAPRENSWTANRVQPAGPSLPRPTGPPLEGEQQPLDEDIPLDVDRPHLGGHQPERGLGDPTARSAGNLATSTGTAHSSGRQMR